MTTPLISTILPTFWPFSCSGMRLLERWVGCGARAASQPHAQDREFTEAQTALILDRKRPAILAERRHPGGVIEASDVRADEGRDHRPDTVVVPRATGGYAGFCPLRARTTAFFGMFAIARNWCMSCT